MSARTTIPGAVAGSVLILSIVVTVVVGVLRFQRRTNGKSGPPYVALHV